MIRLVAAALVFATLGCASGGTDDDAPQPAPAPRPTADARVAELQTSMTELLERIDVLNARIAKLEAEREERPASPAPATRAAAPQPRTTAPAGSPGIATAASSSTRAADIAEQYRTAIVHFSSGRIPQARAAFQAVFDADPSSELADNALFWIGETFFGVNDFANAITFYSRVGTDYADQNKAPDALYKLGVTYAKTGDLVLARRTLQDVIARYPYSTAAASSRTELERIKY